ncbi:hypothetical protein L1887_01363 [Cichorium endivia]|nr:hypothetical protein L1887_01363 [Cichorium endivia]
MAHPRQRFVDGVAGPPPSTATATATDTTKMEGASRRRLRTRRRELVITERERGKWKKIVNGWAEEPYGPFYVKCYGFDLGFVNAQKSNHLPSSPSASSTPTQVIFPSSLSPSSNPSLYSQE